MRLATALILLALPALAAEEDVTIRAERGDVIGTLETPEGGAAPVVLLLHGFGGSRHELAVAGTEDGVFSRTAEAFASAGVATLRIDFRGSGESPGGFETTTFSGQIADAVAALDWLAEDGRVDGERIGGSQGGLVASHLAAERPDAVDAVVLWAPVANPLHSYGGLLGAETMAEAAEAAPGEPITFAMPWGAEMTLNREFFDEIAVTSPPAAAAAYPGPLKVIVGANDAVVAPQPEAGRIFLDYHDGPEELVVVDADHVWNAFEGPAMLDEEMIPRSLAWFEAHL